MVRLWHKKFIIYELLEFYRYALGLCSSLFSLTCTGYVEFVFQKSIPVTQVSLRGTACLCCVAVVPVPLYNVQFTFCQLQNSSEEVELACIALSLGVLLDWKPSRSDKIAANSSDDDHFVTVSIIFDCVTLWPSSSAFYSNVWWPKEVFVWSKQVDVFSINSSPKAGLDWDVKHCLKVT